MSSSSRLIRKSKHHIRKRLALYQLLGIALVSGLILLAVFGLLKVAKAPAETTGRPSLSTTDSDAARPLPESRLFSLSTSLTEARASEIVRQAQEAYGGVASLQSITSFRKIGQLIPEEGKEGMAATSFWRTPDHLRFSLSEGENTLRFAYNGQVVSLSVLLNNGRTLGGRLLTGEERERFIRNARMSAPIPHLLSRTERISRLPDETFAGRPVFVLALQRNDYEEHLWIDQAHFLCVAHFRDDSDLAGPPQSTEVRYQDHRWVDGRVFPFAQTAIFDGVVANHYIAETIELNPGILSDTFDPPSLLATETP